MSSPEDDRKNDEFISDMILWIGALIFGIIFAGFILYLMYDCDTKGGTLMKSVGGLYQCVKLEKL